MSRVKQPKEEINLNLTSDIESANFRNASVKLAARELIPKLMQTGDFEYLTWLASHELIYREEVFWDQISLWRRRAFQKDQQAFKCLKAVQLGFNKCIRPSNRKRPGRLRKSITADKAKYRKIKKELDNAGLGNKFRQTLNKLRENKSKNRIVNQEFREELNKRTNLLTKFFKKRKIKLTQTAIKTLVWSTSSEIAIYLIAKQERISPITFKRVLAEDEKERKREQDIQKAKQIWARRQNTP